MVCSCMKVQAGVIAHRDILKASISGQQVHEWMGYSGQPLQ